MSVPADKFNSIRKTNGRRKSMNIGVVYPQIELGGDPAGLGAIGLATEELGYDYLLMFDHVAGADRQNRQLPMLGPYSDRDPFHDPLVAFAYLSGITKRIGFATGILVLAQRQTVLVGRQAADVDLFSCGRLRLGVGVGWNPVEYEALGQDFHNRGRRLDEQIMLLRRLWSERPIDFAGTFHRVDRAGLNPLPAHAIPIWCGGGSDPAYRRAARLGDGFVFSGAFEERILPAWDRLQALLSEAGRADEPFGAEYILSENASVERAVEVMRRWQDRGGTHFAVRTMGHGFAHTEQHIDFLADFRARAR
jgi:probable F420-dependent oxidoreductase